jgi:hypothetical protein
LVAVGRVGVVEHTVVGIFANAEFEAGFVLRIFEDTAVERSCMCIRCGQRDEHNRGCRRKPLKLAFHDRNPPREQTCTALIAGLKKLQLKSFKYPPFAEKIGRVLASGWESSLAPIREGSPASGRGLSNALMGLQEAERQNFFINNQVKVEP